MIRIRAINQEQLFDPKRAGRQFNILAIAGKFVGALAIDFDGGKFRRHLLDVADERAQRIGDVSVFWTQVTAVDHFAFGIVGVGGLAETHGEAVGFQRVSDVGNGLCCFTKCNRQNACRFRIKRASVPCFFRIQRPFHFVHNSGRGDARRFVDNEPTRDIATFAFTCHLGCP